MALTTSLTGRVRNTSLPVSHALLPLLEAVVNGIQAIEARFGTDVESGRLQIQINREAQEVLDIGPVGPGRAPQRPIVGFNIVDNGIGFTRDNMRSFETLDSDHKAVLGCRGVGRLLWLKAFERVAVRSSYFDEHGGLRSRQFRFSIDNEVTQQAAPSDMTQPGSVVILSGFKKEFQQRAPKTIDAIAREVFEHCAWYFLRPGGAPDVAIIDEDETVVLAHLLDEFVSNDLPTSFFEVKGRRFEMVSLRLKSSARISTPRLHWCAASRVVIDENIAGKVPGLYGRLRDNSGTEFTYVSYLSSDFLDAHVRADRTAFDISERIPGESTLDELSLEEIRAQVFDEIQRVLADPLAVARDEGRARVNDFVSHKAPRYRPVLARMEALGITVDPAAKDQDLELELHRGLQRIEAEIVAEGQAVFAPGVVTTAEEYQQRVDEFLDTVTEVNQSDLAAYVFRRRKILDLLKKLIRLDNEGKYSREDAIHSLLMPMRKDSNEVGPDGANLWVIDERLAFHDYLASDKTLKSMPNNGSDSTTEPDILATCLVDAPVLAAEGDSAPLPSIVVVEIKRPMRNDATEDKDPIQQCLNYVKRVRAGGVRTASGRPIPATQEPPAFCYIIADLTPTMVDRCEFANLQPTHDRMGYFGFNGPNRAYIEVINFDRLVNAATQRNRAFFDRLGLPSS